jgi:hypothetical protein
MTSQHMPDCELHVLMGVKNLEGASLPVAVVVTPIINSKKTVIALVIRLIAKAIVMLYTRVSC